MVQPAGAAGPGTSAIVRQSADDNSRGLSVSPGHFAAARLWSAQSAHQCNTRYVLPCTSLAISGKN